MEWYDFAIYGALATVIARVFFPTGGHAALAATFAVLATSFIARPVGALVIGRRSDRVGRRPTLSGMIAMMSFSTAAIGLLPTWSSAGAIAPLSLLLLRIAQGFSVGGEVPSSIAFLIESAPERRRGWFAGWHLASIAIGLAIGYGFAALLAAVLSDEALLTWGWRVAFLVAAPLGLVARYIRRRLQETPTFDAAERPATPHVAGVLRGWATRVVRGFVPVAVLALAFNLWFVFLPSYVAASGLVPLDLALGIGVVGLSMTAAVAPVVGRLSDRIGRRPGLIVGALAVAAFAGPGFSIARGSTLGFLISEVVMGLLMGSLVVAAFVAELFPTALRATGVALSYGLASALFGGTAPWVATVLTGAGVAWLVPAFVAGLALSALPAVAGAGETAFRELT